MKLIVKRFGNDDIASRVNWINNPAINGPMYFELPASVEKTTIWYKNNIGNKRRIDFSFFDNDTLIAMGGLTDISNEHKNTEFYVMVNPDMHGRGIGKTVSQWIFNYAFSILDLNKVYLYTNDDNKSAYSIYEKSGFVLEGVLREHKLKNGKYQNRRFYGLLKADWEKQSWKKTIENEL